MNTELFMPVKMETPSSDDDETDFSQDQKSPFVEVKKEIAEDEWEFSEQINPLTVKNEMLCASGQANHAACDVSGMNCNLQEHNLDHDETIPLGSDDCGSGNAARKKRGRAFACDECGRGFATMSTLKVHARVHTGERPFQCDACQKTFISREGLRSHLLVHTQERRFECDLCDKKFLRKQEMQHHRLVHTGERPYVCEVCLKTFPRQQRLRKHLQTHTGERPHACDQCDKKFAYRGSLKYHLRRHAGIKPYRCDLCPMSFTSNIHLKKHRRIHTGVKPFCCHVCRKPYSNRESFQKHVLSHGDPQQSATEKAPPGEEDSPSGEEGLQNQQKEDDVQVESFGCEKCGKGFASYDELSLHPCVQTMHKELFVCDTCKEGFADQDEFDKHRLHHQREKPFACFVCGLRLFRSANLNLHLSIMHSEAKPFLCKICDKNFLSEIQMRKHLATHSRRSGEKTSPSKRQRGEFFLDQGGNTRLKFLRYPDLHQFGKKPYYCELCFQEFVDRCYLLRHKRAHAREKPDACPICHVQYSSRHIFLKHVHNHDEERSDLVHSQNDQIYPSETIY